MAKAITPFDVGNLCSPRTSTASRHSSSFIEPFLSKNDHASLRCRLLLGQQKNRLKEVHPYTSIRQKSITGDSYDSWIDIQKWQDTIKIILVFSQLKRLLSL